MYGNSLQIRGSTGSATLRHRDGTLVTNWDLHVKGHLEVENAPNTIVYEPPSALAAAELGAVDGRANNAPLGVASVTKIWSPTGYASAPEVHGSPTVARRHTAMGQRTGVHGVVLSHFDLNFAVSVTCELHPTYTIFSSYITIIGTYNIITYNIYCKTYIVDTRQQRAAADPQAVHG